MGGILVLCLLAGAAWNPADARVAAETGRSSDTPVGGAIAPTAVSDTRSLTTAVDLRSMTAAAAERNMPVRLRGIVTFYDRERHLLFIHDETAGIFVMLDSWPALRVGDVVEVTGQTDQGHFAPRVGRATVRVIGHEPLPHPRQVHFTRLLSGYEDSQWMEIEGIVRTVFPLTQGRLFFHLVVAGVRVPVQFMETWSGPVPANLVDARVRVRAVVASRWNTNRQLAGIVLYIPSREHLVVEIAAPDVHTLTSQPIGDLFRYTSAGGFEHRVRTAGTVVGVRDRQFYVRDNSGAIVANTTGSAAGVKVGDRVELAGFPESGTHTPILRDVTVLSSRNGPAPDPVPATSAEILGGSFDSQLVSLEATLIQQLATSERQVLLLEQGGVLFTAEIDNAAPFQDFRHGSRLRVAGICNIQSDERENPRVPRSFKLLLRSPQDVVVLSAPTWWTLRHTIYVVSGLLLTILMVFGWVVVLRRRVRAQTGEIRERLQHEIMLQAQYRELFENANDVVCTYDAGGRLTSWNRAGERITGFSRSDAITMRLRDMIAEDHRKRIDAALEQTIQNATGATFEADLVTRDGRRVTLELDTHPIQVNNGQIGVQAIGRNVTQRKQTEAVLRRAKDAAEMASRAKTQFVTNMSHEVRTPLNGILGMTSVLLNTEVTNEQSHYLQMVRTSAESLMHIINDVLDFSKIEAGRLELHDRPFDLRESVIDVLQGMALTAREGAVALSCRVAPELPSMVVADGERLRQVLVNLVGNAVKFTNQGEVRVQVDGRITTTTDGAAKWLLEVRVSDTGIGISPDKHQMIFDAFTQVDSSVSRRHGGAGLGLAISSSLVRLMGGSMELESAEGCGSTFTFTVPVGAGPDGVEVASLTPARVLVVDGHVPALDSVCDRLERWGLEPVGAVNVKEAIRLVEAQAAGDLRIVLVDTQTAEDSMEPLVACLRQRVPDARLLLCAQAPQQWEMELARQYAGALLPKPLRDSELLTACRAALEASPRSQPHAVTGTAFLPGQQGTVTVLLVEDNVINQRVAEQILRRRGHEVRIACHGRQALEILEQWTPDVVLMDVQMPEMNGIEATVAIRARERSLGGHLPIVAMTAHAMAGDRERCLRAGMDEYLTKPVSPAALTETVERIAEQRTGDRSAPGDGVEVMSANNGMREVYDLETALERVDGDRELLREIVGLFLHDVDTIMSDLDRAVSANDAETIMRTAHRLKGSVATFAARPATEAALRLETIGRNGDTSEAASALVDLQAELARLRPALQSLAISA